MAWIVGFADKNHRIRIIIEHSFLQHIQHIVKFKPSLGSGESGDDHIRLGIGCNEILVVFVVDLDHFITHESSVEHIDFV